MKWVKVGMKIWESIELKLFDKEIGIDLTFDTQQSQISSKSTSK